MSNIQRYPIKSLPAGEVSYPEDWSIEITPYLFGQSSGINESDITSKRFYNCILDGVYTNFNKNLLTIEDTFFIGAARKLVTSKSNKVILTSKCPVCLNENKITLNLQDAINFEKSKISNRKKYPIKVSFPNGYIGWYKFLTLDESLSLMKTPESRVPGIITNLAKRTVKLVELVGENKAEKVIFDVTKDNHKLNFEALENLYSTFVDEDAQLLEDILDLFESSKLMPIEVQCQDKKCGHTYKQELELGALTEYLSPFRGDSGRKIEDYIDF